MGVGNSCSSRDHNLEQRRFRKEMTGESNLALFLLLSPTFSYIPKVKSQNTSARSLTCVTGQDPNDLLGLFLSFPHTLPALRPAQLPDLPAFRTPLHHLSSLPCSITRFFSDLLRRPPPATGPRRWDCSPQLPAWPAAWLSPVPHRLLLLLAASMALPGRPPRGRRLKLANLNPEPREEDSCTGKSSPEFVSIGDSTKPILGLPRPQPFPLVLSPTDPTQSAQGWAHWAP